MITSPVTDMTKQEISKSLERTNKNDVSMVVEKEMAISPEVPAKSESTEHYPTVEVSVQKIKHF
jgi:hypothetical protein